MKKCILLIVILISFSFVQAQKEPLNIGKDIPVFPGCANAGDWKEKYSCNEDAIFDYIQKEIRYPKEAFEKKQQGVIYISFLVSKSGFVNGVKITKGLYWYPSLEAEAIRVIESMPKMVLGKTKGRSVAVKYTQIIRFNIDEENQKEGQKDDQKEELTTKVETKKEKRKIRRRVRREQRKAK